MKNRSYKFQPFRDRFVYRRTSTDRFEEFGVKDSIGICNENDYSKDISLEDNPQNKLYKVLIQSQLFGLHSGQENGNKTLISHETTNSRSLISNNLSFANQSENGCFSLSPICGITEANIIQSFNCKRTIPKSPYKVLDAPALQDD